jgi:hypothetical protein
MELRGFSGDASYTAHTNLQVQEAGVRFFDGNRMLEVA